MSSRMKWKGQTVIKITKSLMSFVMPSNRAVALRNISFSANSYWMRNKRDKRSQTQRALISILIP
jgi:hypothetical protein